MRTIWASWNLDDMQDAADVEGHVSLDALAVPEQRPVESLPYYGAFSDYQAHVAGCVDCLPDDRPDCREGETSLEVSRVGVTEQHRLAAFN